jgi:glycosyltransferase involved in cell wall biosynthesis
MKKIIFVGFIGAFGGVERLILSLSRYLHERDMAHTVVCFRDTLDLASHADWPLEVIELKPGRNCAMEAKALKLYFDALKGQVDGTALLFDLKGAFYAGLANLQGFTLHLTDPPSLLATESSRFSAAYRRWSGTTSNPSVVRRAVGELVHRINRRGALKAGNVITMTQRISNELESLYGVRTRIIRPGVAGLEKRVASLSDCISGRRRLLSVSRLESSKRLDVVIKALASLNSDTQNHDEKWTLDVAGTGPIQQELENMAESLGLADQVTFHGRVSDDELDDLFGQAGIFVMPAVQGYGLPALEALQRGVPVVMHRDSGASEIFEETPWVEIIRNSDELAPALKRILARFKNREMINEPRPHVPSDVDWAEEICRECGWLI